MSRQGYQARQHCWRIRPNICQHRSIYGAVQVGPYYGTLILPLQSTSLAHQADVWRVLDVHVVHGPPDSLQLLPRALI
jgi:hypothetical protein